jgi:hypothetical protein
LPIQENQAFYIYAIETNNKHTQKEEEVAAEDVTTQLTKNQTMTRVPKHCFEPVCHLESIDVLLSIVSLLSMLHYWHF